MTQNELQRLLPRHYEILRLCLLGLTRKDISLAVKMSPEGVGLVINSPLFQDELSKRRQNQFQEDLNVRGEGDVEAINILQEAASSAARKHVSLLSSDNERVAQISANSILDRVLGSKGEIEGVVKLDKATINLLQITINEIRDSTLASCAPEIEREDVGV